jgi:hypothetical protein
VYSCTTGSNPVASSFSFLTYLLKTLLYFKIMVITFFALRPMFTAVDRLVVDRAAFLLGTSISYFSRKKSRNSVGLHNVFGLTAAGSQYGNLQKFASTHSFILMAALLDGELVSLEFAKSVYSFSLLGFYPVGLFRVITRVLLLPLLRILGLLILNVKSHAWLL